MWSRLRLKARLMLLFALLLLAGMTVNVGLALHDAGPRVAAEDDSSMRLAQDLIQSAAPALDASADPRALQMLIKSLGHMRHISVSLRGDPDQGNASEGTGEAPSDVPAWFVRLIGPAKPSIPVEIASGGHPSTVVIAADPLDEIGEIWDGITAQLATGSVLAAALLAITFVTVGRALAPVAELSRAMTSIGQGRYDVLIEPWGPPEIADMCRQMNALAAVLGTTVREKQRLAERIVTLQDNERRDLARELHDEFGPYLFAIRAQVAALARGVPRSRSGSLTDAVRAISDQVDALQASNRRVLRNLRPVALEELGLDAALTALIDGLRESRPDVEIAFTAETNLEAQQDPLRLTIYRVVQEALTNALRHADATRVRITIMPSEDLRFLAIRVTDNGVGMPDPFRDGFGLTGMRERLAALGGQLDLRSSRQEGTQVEALIPAFGSACLSDAQGPL